MTTITATYSPEDNKLRLYASQRLDAETYARLIAAAPAMLAALERVAAWIDAGCNPSAKSIEAMRAAIAQAKGGQA